MGARTTKNPDDVVITLAVRTPLAKAHKGGFKDTPLDGILVKLLKQVIAKSKIDPAQVEDICLGNVRLETISTRRTKANIICRSRMPKPHTTSEPRCSARVSPIPPPALP